MKWQTSLGKAFEINKNPLIYGTFAEIGAGQETVNVFYKAGLASQTVAKSMSAYDMTVSDEIYGKQNRYVSKDRLLAMLDHEYRLLERRLKKSRGGKTCFFAFATTAATSAKKKDSLFSNSQHAWMGLRFQARPLRAFNDIIFHVSCLDKNRLQQHEALGILGVNLIYACFFYGTHPKKLIASLRENLSGSRIEIHGISLSGPALKSFSELNLNREILSQKLSSLIFFPQAKKSAFLSDSAFKKNLVITYGDQSLIGALKGKKARGLKALGLDIKKTIFAHFVPKNQLRSFSFKKQLKKLCQGGFSVLTASDLPLEELKKLVSLYIDQTLVFIVSQDYFTNKLFGPSANKNESLLKKLGLIFDKKTKLAVFSKNKTFSLQEKNSKKPQEERLKNYLISKKQIMDIKF